VAYSRRATQKRREMMRTTPAGRGIPAADRAATDVFAARRVPFIARVVDVPAPIAARALAAAQRHAGFPGEEP
jgi:hypothetical protein